VSTTEEDDMKRRMSSEDTARFGMSRILGAGASLGALVAFLFDPQQGKRRRHQLVSRSGGILRRTMRRSRRIGRAVGAEAYGIKQKALHLREEPKDFDDVTLARKVETEIFRGPDVPKGQINVNAEEGIVYLRGEAPTPDMIDDLVERTRKIQGVREVRNLLHLPKIEPAMKE
jgi:osmotically-inducible protein OsmY